MLECVSIGPHYCKQYIINAVVDDHFVHKVGFKRLEEDDDECIDDDDEENSGDQEEKH